MSAGIHKGEVISSLESFANAFGQLAAIFEAIATNGTDARRLAEAGFFIANDFENSADSWREQIKASGIRHEQHELA